MRLLFVTPRYMPMMGGVENHVYQVATRLAQRGVDTTVLTTDPQGELPARELLDGVQVRRVRAWPADKDYYLAPALYRHITSRKWDLVHVQSYHTLVAPLAMLAAWRARLPYVVTFHGGGHSSQLRHSLRRMQRTALRPLLARAARLVAIARFEIELFSSELRIARDHFVLIPNGADLPSVTADAASKQQNGTGTLLVSIGRLERYKGHHRVIAALPHVLQQRPDARLWIAGSGPYETELRRQAGQLGVADRVEIRAVPPAERAQMAQELSRADLVTLMSDYETHPIAALEALALGCRVLVANTSGLRELADDGLTAAVPLDSSPEALAAAILRRLETEREERHLNLPTWDDCAHSLHSLYHTIVTEAACAS